MANAYFVPDDLSVRMLVEARKRGVHIEIIVPGVHTDSQIVGAESRDHWATLLDAGVAINEFKPTMMHCKIMVVDELFTTVGSTNFDNRSFHLNDEANLDVFDAGFARENLRHMDEDKARSRLVTSASWAGRSWAQRLSERVAGVFDLQL